MHNRLIYVGVFALVLAAFGAQLVLAVSPNIAIYEDQYRTQLEKYRIQSDQTTIALTQYSNLKTLASQEEAVQAMRSFLLIRADVVTTHLNVLTEILSDRTTLDPAWTASVSALLDDQKTQLASHRARSDIAVDRIKADDEAVWFLKDQMKLLVVADRTQSMIAMGRVQEAINALESTKGHIDAWIASASMSETARVEKRRGSDELGRTLEASKKSLDDTKMFYTQTTLGTSTALAYPRIRPTLLKAYTQVTRGVEFAKELTQ